MKLQLSIALASNPRTWPILDGRVQPDGIDLIPTVLHPSEMFWRQLKFADFDVSEMSFSSLMMAVAGGDDRWVGLPIFTTRKFFHTEILVRKESEIKTPADLNGRRVGVPEYQQTAALWTRGILQHEFGVPQQDMQHWMERVPTHSHAASVGFKAPPGVTINPIPPEKNIGSMMLAGELDEQAKRKTEQGRKFRGHPGITAPGRHDIQTYDKQGNTNKQFQRKAAHAQTFIQITCHGTGKCNQRKGPYAQTILIGLRTLAFHTQQHAKTDGNGKAEGDIGIFHPVILSRFVD